MGLHRKKKNLILFSTVVAMKIGKTQAPREHFFDCLAELASLEIGNLVVLLSVKNRRFDKWKIGPSRQYYNRPIDLGVLVMKSSSSKNPTQTQTMSQY